MHELRKLKIGLISNYNLLTDHTVKYEPITLYYKIYLPVSIINKCKFL